ncbi:MAG: hypothetical protein FE047_01745 [Thermoplasmata archaeon]|nr:MAG: hypothetical protein FE047_01745 [Thermoplasmata archaeon]
MMNVLEDLKKGIIVEINDVKQAISVDKCAHAIFIGNFDLDLIEETIDAVSVPVIASCRIGHFVEAKILEKLGVHVIDESNPNNIKHIKKKEFFTPFMCKVQTIDDAFLRIEEGAVILRTEWGYIDEVIWLINEGKEKGINAMIFCPLKMATPADVAFLFQIGGDAIIVSSQIFRSPNPPKLLDSLVNASRYYNEIDKIADLTKQANKILPAESKQI